MFTWSLQGKLKTLKQIIKSLLRPSLIKIVKDLLKKNGARNSLSLFLSTYSYGVQKRIDLKSSMQCPPYFKKYFETPCIK